MSYNFTIDLGNTALKAVLWKDGMTVDSLTVRNDSDKQGQLADFISSHDGISAAIGCSVVKTPVGWLRQLMPDTCRTIIELTPQTPTPLVNRYATPLTLGTDRMAAAVGAWTMFPGRDILVCDLGTAATYDVVSADGCFMGGNIAPGVGMRLRALHSYTCRLPEVNSRGPVTDFGTDTTLAMRSGALQGIVAEILHYRTLGSKAPRTVVLTGGWADDIMNLLPDIPGIHLNKNLVNQGLNSILLYNET